MPLLAFAVHVAALVLAVAGVAKLVDPTAVDGALRASGWPAGRSTGRVIGLGEVGVGVWALTGGGRASATALVAVYGGFVAFIASNRWRGLHVPCGCFGRSDSPPGVPHLVVDLVAIVVGAAAVAWPVGAAVEWLDHGAGGVIAVAGVVVAGAAVIVGLEAGPRSSRP